MGPKRDPRAAARVRAWALEAIGTDAQTVVVVVTELACSEPGCPPVETVIGVLDDAGQVQHKIHKALDAVTQADVVGALGPA